jgi:hypothetical protein
MANDAQQMRGDILIMVATVLFGLLVVTAILAGASFLNDNDFRPTIYCGQL